MWISHKLRLNWTELKQMVGGNDGYHYMPSVFQIQMNTTKHENRKDEEQNANKSSIDL